MVQLLLILAGVALFGWLQFRFGMAKLRRELDAKALPLDDQELSAEIRRLGALVDLPDLRAQLFEMPVINGLATPDGRIFLTTALAHKHRMGLLTTPEVLSVVAHELGHVALGHHQRRLIDWTGQNAARMALGLVLNRFIPILGFYIADFLARMVMARLSRRDEFEADRYASALMIKAGHGVGPQISMFGKLARMVPGPKGAAWLASHPPTPERVAAIEANADAWSARAA